MVATIICIGIGMLLGASAVIVIACCIAGDEDDDQEQLDYIKKWNEQKGKKND